MHHRILLAVVTLLMTCAACTGTGPGPADPDAIALPSSADAPSVDAAPPASPGGTTPPAVAAGTPAPIEVIGTFPTDVVGEEVSGLAASQVDPERLWLLDDGPRTTSVTAVALDGTVLATVEMIGVEGRDTEALAIGPCAAGDPSPCVYVGDIGDNEAVRESVHVHRFPEPVDLTGLRDSGLTVEVATATYTLPGGAVDAEAMLIDGDGLPLLITKQDDAPPRLLGATAFADGVLVDLGQVPLPLPTQPLLTLFTGNVVTDAARSPAGDRVILRTYDHAVLLLPPGPGVGLRRMPEWTPTEVPVAAEGQGEAITFVTPLDSPPGWVTASEGSGALSYVAG